MIEQIDGKAFDEAALQAALALKIEPYAIPTLMRVVPRLPRNDNDKLDRNAVVAWLKAEETSAAARAASQGRRP